MSLTLHWTATGRVAHNLRVFVHLVGPDGQVWGQSDKFHPGEFVDLPTGRWPPGYVLADTHTVYLAPDAPPGQYEVRVGLWNRYAGVRQRLLDAAGEPAEADAVVLTRTFEVLP